MTREEAIKTIKENCCAMCAYGSQDMDSCDIRSCDNKDAIKALEQEPCEDAISREEAKKAMFELCGDGSLKENSWRDNPNIDAIIDALDNIPSVTPKQKTSVIDEIRTEISDFEEEVFHRPNTDYSDYAAIRHCLEIIDKYREIENNK